jgi:hypothetical protein
MDSIQITVFDIVKQVGIRHAYKHFKFKHPDLFEKITQSQGERFAEQLYCFIYGITTYPTCQQCGIEIKKFRSFRKGYAFFCSNKCVAVNRAHQAKKQDTCHATYGTDTASQNAEVDEKRRQTLIDKYGTDNLAEIRWRRERNKNK